ncbi:MAG: sugar phosphate isomerase/epimerase [Prevotellaceae bacterium]|jgi:sugar phosphate isomerase/epimerase|nr:sugar phosphate isomerase/epimerase [Prevotellaceae bacterium]
MDNRRNFIKKVGLAGALMSVGSFSLPSCEAKDKKSKLPLKLSFQEGIPPGKSLNEKFDYMEKLGVVGFEPGGGNLAGRVQEIKDALKGRNIKVSAICAGFGGWLLADNPDEKQKCIDSTKTILAAAGELGSVGMILVPAFNHQKSFPHTQATRDQLVADLKELGAYANEHKTQIILEPLNRREAFYLRLVADAAALCKDVDSPGVRCLGDFWHMTWEETSDRGAFISAGKYLTHVHIASRKRRLMPGEDGEADNYVDGFKGLKEINYQGFVSFECGTKGNREETVPAAVKLLKEQWEQA